MRGRKYNDIARQITLVVNGRNYWFSGQTTRFSFRTRSYGFNGAIDSNQLSNCLSDNQCRRLFANGVHGNYIRGRFRQPKMQPGFKSV